MDTTAITNSQLSNGFLFTCYQDCYGLCGQPKLEDLKEFQNAGWDSILNLRNQEELKNVDFNMPLSCKKLGLEYNHIPIIMNGEFNKPALQQIHKLLSSHAGKKIVIHCASGKRSILALIMHLFLLGKHTKEELSHLTQELGFDSPQMLARLYDTIENEQ